MSQEGGSKGNVDWASATLNGIPIPTRFGMVTYSAPREPVGLGKFDFSATLETEPGAFEKFVDSLPKPEPIHLIKRGMKITFDHHQSPRSSILQFLFNGKQATEQIKKIPQKEEVVEKIKSAPPVIETVTNSDFSETDLQQYSVEKREFLDEAIAKYPGIGKQLTGQVANRLQVLAHLGQQKNYSVDSDPNQFSEDQKRMFPMWLAWSRILQSAQGKSRDVVADAVAVCSASLYPMSFSQ